MAWHEVQVIPVSVQSGAAAFPVTGPNVKEPWQ
jgi:hypothetical protein